MRQTLSLVLIVTWLMALVTGYTFGGRAHLLAVVALAVWFAPTGKRRRDRAARPAGFRPW